MRKDAETDISTLEIWEFLLIHIEDCIRNSEAMCRLKRLIESSKKTPS